MKKIIRKYIHYILIALGLFYSISFFSNNELSWLLTGLLFVTLGVFFFFKPLKVKEKWKPRTIEEISESARSRGVREFKPVYSGSFHLKGINFNNRQENIEVLEVGDYLTPRYYEFEGEPAIELMLNSTDSVGVVPKEYARGLTETKQNFIVKRVYQFNDGRFGAEIRVE